MRVPPLFNGKVWIGNAYQRPLPNYMTKDGELLQYALLSNKRPSLVNYLLRILGL